MSKPINLQNIENLKQNKIDKIQIKNTLIETIEGNVLDATQGKVLSDKIGDIDSLQTVDKTSIVNAINELKTASGNNTMFGVGELVHETISVTITAETVREVPIPKDGFILGKHHFEVRIGGIPIPKDKYTVQNGKIVLASGEGDFPIGRRLDFVFIYLEQTADNGLPIDGNNINIGTVSKDKLTEDVQAILDRPELTLGVKPADVEIEGRTLVNRLGRIGNAIYKQNGNEAYYAIDKTFENDWFVATINKDSDLLATPNYGWNIPIEEGKCYISLSEIDTSTLSENAVFTAWDSNYITLERAYYVLANTGMQTSFGVFKCTKSVDLITVGNVFNGTMSIGHKVKFRNCRVYEITQEEYDFIKNPANISELNIAEKYPYVDDVKCVINPYIECKENLLENDMWKHGAIEPSGNVIDSETGNVVNLRKDIKTKKGEQYTLYIDGLDSSVYDTILWNMGGTQKAVISQTDTATITCEHDGVIKCGIKRRDGSKTAEQISDMTYFMNYKLRPSVTKGNIPKSYDECHNSRMMFETKLYDGEKITRDNSGTYVKNSEWDEIILNGSFANIGIGKNTSKQGTIIRFDDTTYVKPINNTIEYIKAIKYNGAIITLANEVKYFDDAIGISKSTGLLWITVPNSLTGWGENYLPTKEEVRAFFLGWTMWEAVSSSDLRVVGQYKGTGTKAWSKIWCGIGDKLDLSSLSLGYIISSTSVTTCPTTLNDQGYTPYRLIYKKETPTIEEVKTYGSLTIKDEVNTNISSGLVINEKVYIMSEGDYSFINGAQSHQNITRTKNKVESFFYDGKYDLLNMEQGVWGIIAGKKWGKLKRIQNSFIYVNYLIYKPDTISSFNCKINVAKNTQEILKKTIEELADVNEKLSIENRELKNKIDGLLQISNPNLLINGDFQIWQRGESFDASTFNLKYTVDRWYIYNVGAVGGSVNRISNGLKLSATSIPSGFIALLQPLESIKENETYTASIKIKSIRGNAVFCTQKWSGVGAFSLINSVVINSPGEYSFTFNTKDINGAKLSVCLASDGVNGEFNVECEYMKLELGDRRTTHMPRHYAEELSMCQRYYEVKKDIRTRSYAYNANSLFFQTEIVEKRITPTITVSSDTTIKGVGLQEITGYTFSTVGAPTYVRISADKVGANSQTDANLQCGKLAIDAEIY